MQVVNNAKHLKTHLETVYQERIEAIKKTGAAEAEAIADSYTKEAQQLQKSIEEEARRQATTKRTQAIAHAKQEAKHAEEQAIHHKVDEALHKARKRYENEKYLKQIEHNVTEELNKRGITDAEITVDEENMIVYAENNEIKIQDSLDEQLEAAREQLIKQLT